MRDIMTPNNSLAFNIEPYDLYAYFFESIVGLELARRNLCHTFHGRFGSASHLPPVIDERDLIASDTDRHGRMCRKLPAWARAPPATTTEPAPTPRPRIGTRGSV